MECKNNDAESSLRPNVIASKYMSGYKTAQLFCVFFKASFKRLNLLKIAIVDGV